MNRVSARLASRVPSLMAKTSAGACIPPDPWTNTKVTCNSSDYCCTYTQACHHDCNGATACGAWNIVAGSCRQYHT
jgi:hypothetical protein